MRRIPCAVVAKPIKHRLRTPHGHATAAAGAASIKLGMTCHRQRTSGARGSDPHAAARYRDRGLLDIARSREHRDRIGSRCPVAGDAAARAELADLCLAGLGLALGLRHRWLQSAWRHSDYLGTLGSLQDIGRSRLATQRIRIGGLQGIRHRYQQNPWLFGGTLDWWLDA